MKASREDPASSKEYRWEHRWGKHESMQLRRLARLSLSDKLSWLEQAHRVVIHLQSGRRHQKQHSEP